MDQAMSPEGDSGNALRAQRDPLPTVHLLVPRDEADHQAARRA